jgi:subtilisin family serine protease
MQLPSGDRATGGGVPVAVIDTGFYPHPYYIDYGYNITAVAAADASDPTVDEDGHGTEIISNLLACAPDVQLFGIKFGKDQVPAFDMAMSLFVDVISCSWEWPFLDPTLSTLPTNLIPLWYRILTVVASGTVVVVGGGNGPLPSFPAMMYDVIAVGGVQISDTEQICAWTGATSFTSLVFTGRKVPDLCGVACEMSLPCPTDPSPTGDPGDWETEVGTSLAAAQVAGICALLLQKDPSLTVSQIRNRLLETASDVRCGTTATGDTAGKGKDRATGFGFVDALSAWQSI